MKSVRRFSILAAVLAALAVGACGEDDDGGGGGGGGGGADSGLDAGTGDGGGGGADAGGGDAGTGDAGPSGGADAGAQAYTITIKDFTYSPQNLTVPAGATVTVVNQDAALHSVTSTSTAGQFVAGSVAGVSFDTGPFTGTTTFTIDQNAPGGTVVPYFCTVHPTAMRNQAQITVQ